MKVLDMGYIELVETWGSDERIVEAARMSTNKGFQNWEQDEKLLRYLYTHKHDTPFEMAGAVVEVKAPIMVFREWHRHRTQSYNEMSARYIPLPDENYVPAPEDLVQRSAQAATSTNRQASGTGKVLDLVEAATDVIALEDYYREGQRLYNRFLDHGWPKELARLPVTVGRYSRMRAAANLRNWLGFLVLRDSLNAQKEIRAYAEALVVLLTEAFPRTLALYQAGVRK